MCTLGTWPSASCHGGLGCVGSPWGPVGPGWGLYRSLPSRFVCSRPGSRAGWAGGPGLLALMLTPDPCFDPQLRLPPPEPGALAPGEGPPGGLSPQPLRQASRATWHVGLAPHLVSARLQAQGSPLQHALARPILPSLQPCCLTVPRCTRSTCMSVEGGRQRLAPVCMPIGLRAQLHLPHRGENCGAWECLGNPSQVPSHFHEALPSLGSSQQTSCPPS